MKRLCRTFVYLSLAAILIAGAAAHADTFSFQISGSEVSGSGYLTAVADATTPGAFDITSISGSLTFAGAAPQTITSLLPCSTYSLSDPCGSGLSFEYDDLLYPAGLPPFDIVELDYRGVGFVAGGESIDIAMSSSHQDTLSFNGESPHEPPILVSFIVTPTPEPSSLILLGSGALAMGITIRRRLRVSPGIAERS